MSEKAVVCGSCGTAYTKVIDLEQEQALDCANSVLADGVRGEYGSRRHDMRRYYWTVRPDWVCGTVICDDCTDRLISEGAINRAYESDPFGDPVSKIPSDELSELMRDLDEADSEAATDDEEK